MKTQTGNCQDAAPASTQTKCLPCDIPAFCRNRYFTGKLLTERDFSDEQRYQRDKLRLHNAALHGWGVVCGLEVKPHPYCPDQRLSIESGFALDDCGREIRVMREIQVDLPKPPPPPPAEPCPPDPAEARLNEGDGDKEHEDRKLYVCIRYCESETEFMPAPFDECGCNATGQKAGRICEQYEILLLDKEPESFGHARHHCECGCDDCRDIYKEIYHECHKPGQVACVPLAIIHDYKPGAAVTAQHIDNSARPLLPSTRVLDRVVRCILEKLPHGGLTRISQMNWTHGEEYHCHDFMRFFVGTNQAPRGFEIGFDAKIRHDGLSPRSFQARVVRRAAEESEPLRMEVAPAKVVVSDDGTKCTLHLDHGYAAHHLDGHNFDLFLTLKCDVVLDEHGTPVDGNLLARLDEGAYIVSPPTGDGVPGGLFESWIRVRSVGDQHNRH
jgi:hypothetical protein